MDRPFSAEEIRIRHSSTVDNDFGIKEITKQDTQFLIEKIIGDFERSNPYNPNVKKPEITSEIEKKL